MNTPPTLDRFETALLEELRTHVATRPAVEAAPAPRRRHRRRWAAGLAAAAAAATTYVVVSPGGPAVSPAYAVTQDADGDVVVTVHRLEDADGLEVALREHGIDADVEFNPAEDTHEVWIPAPGTDGDGPPEEGGTRERRLDEEDGYRLELAEPGVPGEAPLVPDCGDTENVATLTREGSDWVLRIPSESPLHDRKVAISTNAGGGLGVAYEANTPGAYCAVMSAGR